MSATVDFQQLVDQQYAPLHRFALSLAKSEADAADLTQQTFFLWASKGDQLRDRSKAKSWLFTTLYREFLGRRRHEVRFPKVELEEIPEEEMSILPNVNALDSGTILQALHEVEEPFRAPLTLFLPRTIFLSGNRRHARSADRHGDVAPLARQNAVASAAALKEGSSRE
jgi:RNA polymerase sigma-70 factor (ECF subfamily)